MYHSMTSNGYIIMVIVDSRIIWFNLDCIMQMKLSYYIATNVCSRTNATTFGNLPDCLLSTFCLNQTCSCAFSRLYLKGTTAYQKLAAMLLDSMKYACGAHANFPLMKRVMYIAQRDSWVVFVMCVYVKVFCCVRRTHFIYYGLAAIYQYFQVGQMWHFTPNLRINVMNLFIQAFLVDCILVKYI